LLAWLKFTGDPKVGIGVIFLKHEKNIIMVFI